MTEGQVNNYPHDQSAVPIMSVVPATHGIPKAMPLTIPAGGRVAISGAFGFPAGAAPSTSSPEITGIWIVNDTSEILRVAGVEVTASLGIPLDAGKVMGIQTDPTKTYVFNPATGPEITTVMITGKF